MSAHEETSKKRRKWPWILAGIVAVVVIISVSTGGGGSEPSTASDTESSTQPQLEPVEQAPSETTPAEPETETITYTVATTGGAIQSISYMKPGFNIAQDTDVSGTEWTKEIAVDGPTMGLNMNAQNGGSGTITCSIAHNGEVVIENSSSGQYAVVTCAMPTEF